MSQWCATLPASGPRDRHVSILLIVPCTFASAMRGASPVVGTERVPNKKVAEYKPQCLSFLWVWSVPKHPLGRSGMLDIHILHNEKCCTSLMHSPVISLLSQMVKSRGCFSTVKVSN